MNGLNGIIFEGKVYEAVDLECDDNCAFYDSNGDCAYWRDHCEAYECSFRFSQSLTDKINGNGIQQEDTSAGL